MKKKVLVFAASACLGAAVFTSCKKTDNHTFAQQPPLKSWNATANYNEVFTTPNNIVVNCVDGVLEFASIADYEQAIADLTYEELRDFLATVKGTDFYSYTEQYEDNDLNDQSKVPDYEIIGNLVNDKGLIKIGDYLMCLDFDNNLVYTTESGSKDDLLLAKSGTPVATVRSFGAEKDVLEEVLIPAGAREPLALSIFCRDRWATAKAAGTTPEVLPLNFNNTWGQVKLAGRISYAVYGVYFDLRGRVRTVPAGGNVSTTVANMQLTFDYRAKRRCGQSFDAIINRNVNSADYSESMISSTRALTSYTFRLTVRSSQTSVPGASASAQIQD